MQYSVEYQKHRIEIVFRDYWKNVVTKKNKICYEVISKYLDTHPNFYEISSKLSKLGNMVVEILTMNFSIKDGLKIVSKTKMNNFWSTIGQGLHCA